MSQEDVERLRRGYEHRQRGRSTATGVLVEMHFGQVWTTRGGQGIRMQMYASPEEALEAAGLSE